MNAKHKAFRLGVTGGVGCGKSTVSACLKELGAVVVDADQISHELTCPGGAAVESICRHFGTDVLDEQGGIHRKKLGEKVFSSEAERHALDCIMHPAIQKEMLRQMDEADENRALVIVLDVPLLYECALDALCDQVWVVSVSEKTQLDRITARDRITEEQARARIASQMPLSEKIKRADRVIDNERAQNDVKNELKHLYKELTRKL